MKIHTVANPPPGLTSEPVRVESVSVSSHSACIAVCTVVVSNQRVNLPVQFDQLSELPAPGDEFNLSAWRVP